ncbi:hypothetical protein QNO00_16850 [Arthrobacter sp. zg-Y1219]|uniref:hypothetical protein n=1 Tax=Arthrobacter sp. zg-Y1219 TaxID=3049067 RepID=UPI0024C217F3|nr:hypothetical protein [Arthrobacter sp. zg-Y1219]MDK1361922.1 hypothetical protein [Arthrobacter sp. zg-Y1219]
MDSSRIDIEQWWPLLPASTRSWLMNNNGDVVPPGILQEIEEAGGAPADGAWWFGGSGPDGFSFSDAGVDWIEATANGESPGGL